MKHGFLNFALERELLVSRQVSKTACEGFNDLECHRFSQKEMVDEDKLANE
jgi:hypothetical protein